VLQVLHDAACCILPALNGPAGLMLLARGLLPVGLLRQQTHSEMSVNSPVNAPVKSAASTPGHVEWITTRWCKQKL
jgi:hypothetical protein